MIDFTGRTAVVTGADRGATLLNVGSDAGVSNAGIFNSVPFEDMTPRSGSRCHGSTSTAAAISASPPTGR